MDPFYKQDVFFFVTTIAVVVITVIFIVLGAFVVKILADIKHISKKVRTQADLLSEDINDLRQEVRNKGFTALGAFKFFRNIFKRHKRKE